MIADLFNSCSKTILPWKRNFVVWLQLVFSGETTWRFPGLERVKTIITTEEITTKNSPRKKVKSIFLIATFHSGGEIEIETIIVIQLARPRFRLIPDVVWAEDDEGEQIDYVQGNDQIHKEDSQRHHDQAQRHVSLRLLYIITVSLIKTIWWTASPFSGEKNSRIIFN